MIAVLVVLLAIVRDIVRRRADLELELLAVIGSLRRECLDHVIALDERQLLQVVRSYVAYYNRTRTHLALGKDPPQTRSVQGSDLGAIVAIPEVGGLHHRYERRLAA